MMKKLLALLLALAMLFSVATLLAGCEESGKKKASSSKKDDDEEDDEDDEDDEDNGDDGSSDPTDGDPTGGEPTTGEPTAGEPTTGGNPTTPPATDKENVLLSLQQSLDAYVEAATGTGTTKLDWLAPNAYWEANGFTVSEIHATFPDAYAEYANGQTLEARCTVVSYELLDAPTIARIASNLEEAGLDADKVEAAATAVCNTYSSNGVESVEDEQTIYGVCYDGRWYAMLNERTLFGDFIVYVMNRYTEEPDGGFEDVETPEDRILEELQECMDIYVMVGTGKDFSGLERLAPYEFWECRGYTLDQIYKDFPNAFENYADGEIISADCDIHSYEMLDSNETARIAQNVAYYGLDAGKVEACAFARATMYSSNGETSEEFEQVIYAFCYEGQWYPMMDERTPYADFIIFVLSNYGDVD